MFLSCWKKQWASAAINILCSTWLKDVGGELRWGSAEHTPVQAAALSTASPRYYSQVGT